jgi:hypothetical protein
MTVTTGPSFWTSIALSPEWRQLRFFSSGVSLEHVIAGLTAGSSSEGFGLVALAGINVITLP